MYYINFFVAFRQSGQTLVLNHHMTHVTHMTSQVLQMLPIFEFVGTCSSLVACCCCSPAMRWKKAGKFGNPRRKKEKKQNILRNNALNTCNCGNKKHIYIYIYLYLYICIVNNIIFFLDHSYVPREYASETPNSKHLQGDLRCTVRPFNSIQNDGLMWTCVTFIYIYIWVFPKIGMVNPPKWMVKIMVNQALWTTWDDLGGGKTHPYFWFNTYIYINHQPSWIFLWFSMMASWLGRALRTELSTPLGIRRSDPLEMVRILPQGGSLASQSINAWTIIKTVPNTCQTSKIPKKFRGNWSPTKKTATQNTLSFQTATPPNSPPFFFRLTTWTTPVFF